MESFFISKRYRALILIAGVYDMLVGLGLFFLYPLLYILMSAVDPSLALFDETSEAMAHLKMNGVFMFFVGVGYLFPFVNYEKFKFYIPIFGVGLRTWGGGFLVFTNLWWGLSFTYTIFGAVDLIFAAGFVYFLWDYRHRRVHVRSY
jgi:hypothetical protein